MGERHSVRLLLIAATLLLGTLWAAASAQPGADRAYPNQQFLVTGQWLQAHRESPGIVVVDVRADKDFDGRVIPGAVRLPWSLFRQDDPARGVGAAFVGTVRAQEILGNHGLSRISHVILYDSVANDGGATASYVFWVLDLLGHEKMALLERGIDGWEAAGGELAAAAATPEPVLYQAPVEEIRLDRLASGDFINSRLGDPHYQILDVRSRAEYLGEAPNKALTGGPLKLGHIPTATNVEYKLNWTDPDSKALKPYPALQELYRGLDPNDTVIPYCHSGRRGSFGYFALRLMGFEQVSLYEASWYEWGSPVRFYPVEIEERHLTSAALPGTSNRQASTRSGGAEGGAGTPGKSAGGYISCGG